MTDVAQLKTLQDAQNIAIPVGAWTPPSTAWTNAPAIAPSTVAMKNTTGYTQSVTFAGGTVTVIAVDGVTTGLTSGEFRVRNNSSVAVTYSVAPTTMSWRY